MENKEENKEENKNKVPYKMARIAWPKAKYGLYLAIFIIPGSSILEMSNPVK